MGDFNFRKINWQNKLNKFTSSCLSDCEGQSLIDILDEHSAEQLVNFPTRYDNILDLLITTLPGQFENIHSPDKLIDHDVIAGTSKCDIPYIKTTKTFLLPIFQR